MLLVCAVNIVYLIPILLAMYVGAFTIMGIWGGVQKKIIMKSQLAQKISKNDIEETFNDLMGITSG